MYDNSLYLCFFSPLIIVNYMMGAQIYASFQHRFFKIMA